MATLQTSLLFKLIDQVTGPLKRIVGSVGDVEKAGQRARDAFKLGANIKLAADGLGDFSRKATGVLEAPVKQFMAFEEQMSSVKAATFDLTKAMDPAQVAEMNTEVAKLAAQARELGATTKYSASEVAGGMDILAKNFAGSDLEKARAIQAAMPGILSAAAAMKGSIEETSDISTAAMAQFGLQAKDIGRIGDVLTKTANGSATGLSDLGEALRYSGVSAKAAGLDIETTLGLIGALGNAGKKGSQAGTGLSSVLGNIQASMKKQRSALAALGINIKDKDGNLRPIVELFAELEKAADKKFGKGKGGVRRDRWLQGLVGMGSDKEVLAILMKQAGTGELQALVTANKAAAGTANKVAEVMNANASGAAKNLASAYEELQLVAGEQLIPTATDLLKLSIDAVGAISTWAKEHPDLTKNIVMTVGALGGLNLILTPIIKGVGAVVTVVGGLSAAYAKLVGWAPAVVKGFNLIKTAMLTNPLTATLVGLATAAVLIYEYWEPISDFFGGLWDSVTTLSRNALDWIIGKIEWVGDKLRQFKDIVTLQDTYDSGAAEQQRSALAGMSQAELQRMAGMGGLVGEQAARALQQQREVMATANKLTTIVPAAFKAASRASPPVLDAEETAPPIFMDKAAMPMRTEFDGILKIVLDSTTGEVRRTEAKTSGPLKMFVNDGAV